MSNQQLVCIFRMIDRQKIVIFIADSIGSIPQTVIDSEIEYLKRIHEQCNELVRFEQNIELEIMEFIG